MDGTVSLRRKVHELWHGSLAIGAYSEKNLSTLYIALQVSVKPLLVGLTDSLFQSLMGIYAPQQLNLENCKMYI